MPILSHTETLFYYDGPQVVQAEDHSGNKYVCTLIAWQGDAHKYLCVPVSPSGLCALLAGTVDLLSFYQASGSGELLLASAPHGVLLGMSATYLPHAAIEAGWLPDAGLFLSRVESPRFADLTFAVTAAMLSTSVSVQQASVVVHSDVSRMPRNPLRDYFVALA